MPNTLLQLQIYPTQPGICKNRPYIPRSKCWTKSCNTMYYCTPWTEKNGTMLSWSIVHVHIKAYNYWHTRRSLKISTFFCSNDMSIERISILTTTKDGKECIKIKNRMKWIAFLHKNICSINSTKTEKIKMGERNQDSRSTGTSTD